VAMPAPLVSPGLRVLTVGVRSAGVYRRSIAGSSSIAAASLSCAAAWAGTVIGHGSGNLRQWLGRAWTVPGNRGPGTVGVPPRHRAVQRANR